MTKKYLLPDNALILSNGVDEIRIRKGIWNYEEAVVTLSNEVEEVRALLLNLFAKLGQKEEVDFKEAMEEANLQEMDQENISSMLLGLEMQYYLVDAQKSVTTQVLNDLIHGSLESMGLPNTMYLKPVLFYSDNAFVNEEAQRLAEFMELPLHKMTDEEYEMIANADTMTRFDGLETVEDVSKIQKFLEPYACVVVGLGRLHAQFMRNLNRGLLEAQKPLVCALLDGPFTSLFTINPPETGCFECMEHRILARIEERPAYQRFVEHISKNPMKNEKPYNTPLLASICSMALFESLSISAVGKSKFAGRALNTYLPVMEMQVQDILRVPFCPACGTIAKAEIKEMYTSTKAIMDNVLENIELDD